MAKRWTWVAWSMLAAYLVSMVSAIILSVLNGAFQPDAAGQVGLTLGFSAFMIVGAVIVAHRPATPSGGSSQPPGCWHSPGYWRWNMPSMPM